MTPRPKPDATDSYGPLSSLKPEEDKIDGNGRNVLQSKSLLAYIFAKRTLIGSARSQFFNIEHVIF